MILTLNKASLLSAMIFQAKDDVRDDLNGICFAPGGKVYSTDRYRIFIGEHETDGLNENVIVAIKGPRFSKFDVAIIDTDIGIVTYGDVNGVRTGAGLCEVVVDGVFPDIDSFIPKDNQPVAEIRFNARYLADIEKAAKLYNPHFKEITIKPNGNNNASIIELNGPAGNASVAIMPIRI